MSTLMLKDLLRQIDHSTRRQLITNAAKACLGVSVIGGMNWANSAIAADATAAAPKKKNAKSVIYIFMVGGMSHIDTWDPKPGADTAGDFKAVKTNVNGIQVSEQFGAIGKHMDKMCLIRSMTSSQGAHERAQYLMHTSYAPLASVKHPGLGPWLHRLGGRHNEKLPGSVIVGGHRDSSAGVLGSAYEPITIGNPAAGLQNSKLRMSDSDFEHRRGLLDAIDQNFRNRYPQDSVTAYTRFYQEAVDLIKSDDVKAFDISQESAAIKTAYGANNFGMGLLLARRLVEHGVRYVEVTIGGWDTHQDNFDQLGTKLPPVNQGIAALMDDLYKKGMLNDVLVAQASDFGRTPKINERDGRDHYPRVFTTMLAGGGVKGGQIYGASDDKGAAVKDKPVTPQDFNATIAYALGLPHDKQVFSKIGRPFTLADQGKPVTAIF
ncbi:MAG: DUF1501 domain-containing protein [Phycisphaeraceae bacterium]